MKVERARGYICMAAFRPKHELLVRQIRSIQTQEISEWRCVIGIDGADADTRSAIEAVIGDDQRFVVREFPDNVGFYRNFERLLEEVPLDVGWVALADQDDEWFPEKLTRSVQGLEDAALVVGQVVVVGVDSAIGEISARRAVPLIAEFIDNQVTGSAAVFRRSLLDVALPFPDATDLAFHDHWLGVCALATGGIAVIDAPLQNYIQHGGNVIGEEQPSGIGARMRNLFRQAGSSPLDSLRYLRQHRWGWRVNMARRLLAVGPSLSHDDAPGVAAIARGRLSPTLIAATVSAVVRREAPPARTLGLLIGAATYR